MNSPEQYPFAIPICDLPEKIIESYVDEHLSDEDRLVEAVPISLLVSTQTFLYKSAVDFYTAAIKRGMFPPPAEGLQIDSKTILVMQGHHRLHAYHACGFPIPMRVQRSAEWFEVK